MLSFEEYVAEHYSQVEAGNRPGRRGGKEQVAAKEKLTEAEGVQETENVKLGKNYPDGVSPKPNAAGGRDYFEVGKMLKKGIPEARERPKLQAEIDSLGPNDSITFVDKMDTSNRITYRKGDTIAGGGSGPPPRPRSLPP